MRNIGSAETLEGRTLILTIFLSEEGSPWKEERKDEIYEMIYEAQDWLRDQAQEYEIELKFKDLQFGQEEDVVFERIPDGTEEDYSEWISELCEKLDYDSPADLLETLEEEGSFDNILVLIIANSKGVSYAMPFEDGVDHEYYLEACVVYREDDDEEIKPAIIAHEIMHLFGAADLYQMDDEDEARENRVREHFPDDIMLVCEDDINDNGVGELTAYLVGWHDEKEDWYDELLPADE